jgi:adenosylhomocysteine nucleosidase
MRFVKSVAARYAFHIVRQFCLGWQASAGAQSSKLSART